MRGPAPKPLETRQRRNQTTTAATLTEEAGTKVRMPKLPNHREWHPLTKAWWRDTWRSPMASEYLQADVHGLYVLAELIDRFWNEPSTKLATEIRQTRQNYGLTPLDRRRLQWSVAQVESSTRKNPKPQDEAKAARNDFDPRRLLTVAN